MDIKIIDNFLDDDELNSLKNYFNDNVSFPLYYTPNVSGLKTGKYEGDNYYWNYYFTHVFYTQDAVKSSCLENFYNIFIPKFKQIYEYKSLLRIKLNFYPHTETLREHEKHIDEPYSHYGAVFSLNTCDGFTRLHDGTKIDSIENRILFFDPSLEHNSSTTTNAPGRWNINFNFL
tara:strand:+ start:366 stop:890 length:525 start_codon:yes stop_codon:yes gene_type:complete